MKQYLAQANSNGTILAIFEVSTNSITSTKIVQDNVSLVPNTDVPWGKLVPITEEHHKKIREVFLTKEQAKKKDTTGDHFVDALFYLIENGFPVEQEEEPLVMKSTYTVVVDGRVITRGFSPRGRKQLAVFFDETQGKKISIFDKDGICKAILNEDITMVASYFIQDIK